MAEGGNTVGVPTSEPSPTLTSLHKVVKEKIEVCRWTHKQLSEYLQQLYPGSRGYSVRSLERYCSEADIHRTSRLSEYHVDIHVSQAMQRVSSYKCMQ